MNHIFIVGVLLGCSLPTATCQFHYLAGWAARGPLVPRMSHLDCSNGPPGAYCKNDLSGYIKCNSDGSEEEVACVTNTRCSCFVGLKCDSGVNPCQPFTLPPHLPDDVTTVSYGTLSVRSPMGTTVYEFSKQQYQKSAPGVAGERGDRQDTKWTEQGNDKTLSIQSAFNADTTHGPFVRYMAKLTQHASTCISTNQNLNSMPLLQIPPEAHPDGTEQVLGESAFRWVLRNGGQNAGSATSTEYFYYVDDVASGYLRPKRYFATFNFGPTAKTAVTVTETFGLFYAQLVPSIGHYAIRPAACDPVA